MRSDKIRSFADEHRILAKAKLYWSDDMRFRILEVRGTPYECGYQHGALLRKQIERNIGYLHRQALKKFNFAELFDEVYERMRPYIPEEYIDEMHGLAHGARMPLSVVHAIHILPEIGEWGGKKRIVKIVKSMINGDPEENWGTSCSNFAVGAEGRAGHGFYTVRILDWGLHRISRLHEYPLLTIGFPDKGIPYCNIGWVGFLGAVSGINAEKITLGEMGYGDPPNETLYGVPMPFLLRNVLSQAKSLADVRKIISGSLPTNSFIFLMSDGKSRESEMYIRDPDRFVVFKQGQVISDRNVTLPAVDDVIYGGHYKDKMTAFLQQFNGNFTPEIIMKDVIPNIAMPSNFQNVVYDSPNLRIWVSNAADKKTRAAEGVYSEFDLQKIFNKRS